MALTQISTQGIKDGTITGTDLATNVDLVDNQKLRLGASADLQIYHDGTNDRIDSAGTFLIIEANNHIFRNPAGNEDYAKFLGNGAVELYHNNSKKLETTSGGVAVTGDIAPTNHVLLGDSKKAIFGAGLDLQIYHDGSNSYIKNNTGMLRLHGTQIQFKDEDNNETMAVMVPQGQVELYHDNSKKFETTSGGINVIGMIDTTGNIDIDADNQALRIGASQNFQLVFTGSEAIIKNIGATSPIKIKVKDGVEDAIVCNANGAVELYFDNSKKFETLSTGAAVTGELDVSGTIDMNTDTGRLKIGAGDDLQLYHDGTNSYIANNGGDLRIWAKTDGYAMVAVPDAQVELYHNNTKKLETTSNGATVSVASGDPQLIVTGPGHALLQLISTSGTDHCGVNFGDNDDNNAGMIQYTNSTNIMQFHTNGSEAMRIASNGNALFHTTTNDNTIAGAGGIQLSDDGNGSFIRISKKNIHAVPAIEFHNPNGRVGQIIPSGTSTSYSTSGSDRSLKKNFESWSEDVLALFKNINPQKFNFIQEEDGTEKTKGFIAQEIADSFPEAYIKSFGEDEKYMFNPSGMVVYLMKAIQDLNAKLEVLETEVAALKAA